MRIEWLNKNGDSRVVVFFNGWGMDSKAVQHLKGGRDVVALNDYRTLEAGLASELVSYREVCVVAWSMGVWAAANVLSKWGIPCCRLVALNGTEHPVNDRWGIPERIYGLTERGMNDAGREKFMMRMLAGQEERVRFESNRPQRQLEEVREELTAIRIQSMEKQHLLHWDKVYISTDDVIFSQENQQAWWENRADKVEILPGGHYPFYHFESWEQILEL